MADKKILVRNEDGLIHGLTYYFNEDGLVDWRRMIPPISPKFIYINNDPKNRERIEKKYNKPYSEIDIIKDNVDDSDLIQTLAAAKFLLRLRGFEYLKYDIKEASENYAAVNCSICFMGNYETFNSKVVFEDNASASLQTTNGFGQKYLLEMATNRSMCRAVRNFLNINIVNKEEFLSGFPDEIQQVAPTDNIIVDKLDKLLVKNHITFDQLKIKLATEGMANADRLTKLSDIPKDKIFELIDRIKKISKQ